MSNYKSLNQLGWSPSFQMQLSLEELESFTIGRVIALHRSKLEVETENGVTDLPILHSTPAMTVGGFRGPGVPLLRTVQPKKIS
ncbi:MAG: hypothetical protein P8163_17075 [Candidatus Thiodiazotropha sp.]